MLHTGIGGTCGVGVFSGLLREVTSEFLRRFVSLGLVALDLKNTSCVPPTYYHGVCRQIANRYPVEVVGQSLLNSSPTGHLIGVVPVYR
ncbi:hypothetical protein CCHOA_10960 [Corynebacterium choanae]|uniref:Uncharacterized protein n=1 Tax=Corynebacterium choanae TaxID=1862358 RepID=A0A3G6JD33_9CORY|nr:hypothetical protein CCHOA_10960 [Corynebacterium choanae]